MLSEIAQIITALAAFGAMLLSWHNKLKIREVHLATNSMKDQLVAVTKTEATAAGVLEGRAQMKDEQREK